MVTSDKVFTMFGMSQIGVWIVVLRCGKSTYVV